MRLAEALVSRADCQKRIDQLKQRLLRNAKAQEGDAPNEDPQTLLEELDRVTADLERVIRQVNATNASVEIFPGTTITDALAARDVLRVKQAIYRDLAQAATVVQTRTTRSEVKFVSAVNVSQIQALADDLARRLRELDSQIQEVNWRTDLREDR